MEGRQLAASGQGGVEATAEAEAAARGAGKGLAPEGGGNSEKKTATSRAAVTEGNKMAAPKWSLWVGAQLGLPPLLLLTMALAGGSGTASAEAFDSVLGDTASCHRACQLTYPLHTYPKVGPV